MCARSSCPVENPIAAFPDSERTLAALGRLEVLVVGDVVQNEIVDFATHVWPCTGQLERADLSGLMEFYRLAVIGQLARPIVCRRWPSAAPSGGASTSWLSGWGGRSDRRASKQSRGPRRTRRCSRSSTGKTST